MARSKMKIQITQKKSRNQWHPTIKDEDSQKKDEIKMEIQIALKGVLELWISNDQEMEFQREDDQFQMESISSRESYMYIAV